MPEVMYKLEQYFEDGKWHRRLVKLVRIPGTTSYKKEIPEEI